MGRAEPKSFHLAPEIHGYLVEHGTPPDPVARGLIDATEKLGGLSIMQVAPEQGAFMTQLARLLGATRAIEIGTFTGFSALCLARGLPEHGELLCCDTSEEWTAVGRPFWEQAGVADRIELRIGPALETLRSLPKTRRYDLAFIDADKENYLNYFEELLGHIRPNGVILVDNVLWMGSVIDPDNQSESTVAIRAFNDAVAADARVDCVMLPISDGLTLLRVK